MKLNTLILSSVLVAAAGGAAFADGGEDANDWGPAKPDMFRHEQAGTSYSSHDDQVTRSHAYTFDANGTGGVVGATSGRTLPTVPSDK